MVGPNKQFDKTEVLNKAMNVFWEKGYEATSMQDLVDSMGINRASMYQTYGNKYSLYIASIECYISNTNNLISQTLSQPGSALDNLKQLLKIMIGHSVDHKQQGCLINNTAVEIAPHDADVSKILNHFWQETHRTFETQIQQAISHNELANTINPHEIAFLLNTNLQGLMVMSKVKTPKKILFASIDTLFTLICK